MEKPERRWRETVTQDGTWRRMLLVAPCHSLMKMRVGEGENCPRKGPNKNCRGRCARTNRELEKQLLLPPAPNSPNIYAVCLFLLDKLERAVRKIVT